MTCATLLHAYTYRTFAYAFSGRLAETYTRIFQWLLSCLLHKWWLEHHKHTNTVHPLFEVVSCPDPTLSRGRVWCHKPESLGLRKCWSLVIVSVELQIAQCWIMNLITHFERYDWSTSSRFHTIPINTALRFDWPLQASGASPRIRTCDTRPLLLAWAGWGLGTRLCLRSH